MAHTTIEMKKDGWFARHWGKATVLTLAVAGFLGWYEPVRNQGRLFLCDVATLVGQSEAIPICRAEAPDESDQLALLEWLKAREDQLSPERLELLRRLEAHYVEQAFAVLKEATGLAEAPVDAQAQADAREAVRETVEEGDPEERRALAMIAEGDLDGGLRLLSDLASASAIENAAQWRRIGRLAYAVDTARALDAYEKVTALDQSDPWDAIYLGRLYRRAGTLEAARRTYADALARLPETEDFGLVVEVVQHFRELTMAFRQVDSGHSVLLLLHNSLTIIRPSQQAARQSTTLASTFASALAASPFSINCKVSMENVENVVSAPNNPTTSSARMPAPPITRSVRNTYSTPMSNEPTTLTTSVPNGNPGPNTAAMPDEIPKRKTAPQAPPAAISIRFSTTIP